MSKKSLQIRAVARPESLDVENRSVVFVISDEQEDRHGTIFKLDGWEIDEYMRNPVVCYNHRKSDPNPDTIIGTSRVWKEGGQLLARVTFETPDINPLAEKVLRKIEAGTLKGASVGFYPHEYRRGIEENGEKKDVVYFTRQSLLEWSVVSVPSNPNTLIRSSEDLTELLGEIEEENTAVVDPSRAVAEYLSRI